MSSSQNINRNKKIALISVLTSISISLFILESAVSLPILPPGAKIGLSNLITVTSLYILNSKIALIILSLRIALTSIFFGGGAIFLYSAAAGISSFIAMILLKWLRIFSIIGVSSAGGFFHNSTQIFIASILMNSCSIWNYLPILGTIGIITGFLIGSVSREITSRLSIKQNPNLK
ncbi:MAG: Gx transporter family protein [Selenomonadaceae bacterium]|nr:Gx transporter family protein [Selenomonadaceae bacterium]